LKEDQSLEEPRRSGKHGELRSKKDKLQCIAATYEKGTGGETDSGTTNRNDGKSDKKQKRMKQTMGN